MKFRMADKKINQIWICENLVMHLIGSA